MSYVCKCGECSGLRERRAYAPVSATRVLFTPPVDEDFVDLDDPTLPEPDAEVIALERWMDDEAEVRT